MCTYLNTIVRAYISKRHGLRYCVAVALYKLKWIFAHNNYQPHHEIWLRISLQYVRIRMSFDKGHHLEASLSLGWRHNERDSVSDHQPRDCWFNRLFRRRYKQTSKFRVTGLCAWNSPVTGEFSAQKASNAEVVSIWWRHHVLTYWGLSRQCAPNVSMDSV